MGVRALVAVSVPLATACSYIKVDPAPATIEADAPLTCTDSYWPPMVDVALVAGAAGLAAWTIKHARDECQQGDYCDADAGLAVLFPLPFITSLVYGVRHVHRCRSARAWQQRTTRPPRAGTIGAACIPTYEGLGRCDQGYCDGGRCVQPPPLATTRRRCAEPIASWRAERDEARRQSLFASMPRDCQALIGQSIERR